MPQKRRRLWIGCMSTQDEILTIVRKLSPDQQREVRDFAEFLARRTPPSLDELIARIEQHAESDGQENAAQSRSQAQRAFEKERDELLEAVRQLRERLVTKFGDIREPL